jgi:hypothetical protein
VGPQVKSSLSKTGGFFYNSVNVLFKLKREEEFVYYIIEITIKPSLAQILKTSVLIYL